MVDLIDRDEAGHQAFAHHRAAGDTRDWDDLDPEAQQVYRQLGGSDAIAALVPIQLYPMP